MLRLLMGFLVRRKSLAYKNVNAREIIQEDKSLYVPPQWTGRNAVKKGKENKDGDNLGGKKRRSLNIY